MLRRPSVGYSPSLYILDGRRVVLCEDHARWKAWFAVADRRVARTWIDDVRVSTVFLGLAHSPLPDGSPALFETEVYAHDGAEPVRRYATWEDAESGHAELVALIQAEAAVTQVKANEAWGKVFSRLLAAQAEAQFPA